jgi:hypothetical protein
LTREFAHFFSFFQKRNEKGGEEPMLPARKYFFVTPLLAFVFQKIRQKQVFL